MIFQLIQTLLAKYGFFRGLWIFIDYQFLQRGRLSLPDLLHPIYYRPKTIDRYSVKEVLFNEEYNIDLPIRKDQALTIFDGGANIGYTSIYFANRFPNAKIVAIEPEDRNFELLKRNVAAYPQVETKHSGIWSKPSHLVVRDRGYGLRGFVVEEVAVPTPGSFAALSIPSLIDEYGIPDILKLDIEGSEKEVFESGYEKWLPSVKCLIVEVHDNMVMGSSKAVFQALVQYDFRFFAKGDNLIFLNNKLLPV